MHRVDHPTAVAVLPTPAAAGTPGFFTRGDPNSGTAATVPTADWANAVQEELVGIVLAAGLTLDKANRAQVLAALGKLYGGGGTLGASGSMPLSGGVVLKWGTASVIASGANVATKAIVFPLAFPTFCAVAGGAPTDTGNSASGGWPAFGVSALLTTGFTVSLDLLGYSTFDKNTAFVWWALGY